MSCTCPKKCATRAEMRAAHGTPEKFGADVFNALDFITVDEALAAFTQYQREYDEAPEAEECPGP